jgi:hypothetical protein
LEKSTSYETSYYAVFSNLLSLLPSLGHKITPTREYLGYNP